MFHQILIYEFILYLSVYILTNMVDILLIYCHSSSWGIVQWMQARIGIHLLFNHEKMILMINEKWKTKSLYVYVINTYYYKCIKTFISIDRKEGRQTAAKLWIEVWSFLCLVEVFMGWSLFLVESKIIMFIILSLFIHPAWEHPLTDA